MAMEAHMFKERYRNSNDDYLFSKYTKKIDNHAFRAEYARERYAELVQQKKDKGDEILNNYRNYVRQIFRLVSNDLGHCRVSVVVEHYLR